MNTQPGIFALGTTDHCYLEFDVIEQAEPAVLLEVPSAVAAPAESPGADSSVVRQQLWRHDTTHWENQPDAVQEKAMGRTKPDSIELSEEDCAPG